jgi:DNA-binding transcriptional MerR regulator
MYKIGDFSRLVQVPIRTLRYYDTIGLLRPARVERSTGYRYYAAAQVEQLNRVLVFKDLGFSLREIVALLAEKVPFGGPPRLGHPAEARCHQSRGRGPLACTRTDGLEDIAADLGRGVRQIGEVSRCDLTAVTPRFNSSPDCPARGECDGELPDQENGPAGSVPSRDR